VSLTPSAPPARPSREELARIARRLRLHDLDMVFEAGAGHLGSELSCIDLLVALYFGELRIGSSDPLRSDRDRFVLSKGHAAGALYVTLAEAGFIDLAELGTFMQPDSRLNGHPDRKAVPGVETNTGPLGHGLPVAVGMAKAATLRREAWRTYVLTGDGELQEGSNWEAAMAAAQFELDNLTLIIDHNRFQQGATLAETNELAPLADRFRAFRWHVEEIDGHDFDSIFAGLDAARAMRGRPTCLVAHTFKGEGISFIRDRVAWHHRVPTADEYARARAELAEVAP
jgi:transketolase